jgi:class 3 adenylate cyclase
MEFRVGVNLGDVMGEGKQIYGDGVNVAARLESLAEPGGICVSGTVYDQIHKKLALNYNDLAPNRSRTSMIRCEYTGYCRRPELPNRPRVERRPRPRANICAAASSR